MLGNQLLNSVPGFEEDLNQLKGWTSCTPLVKPVRGGRPHARALAAPHRAEGVARRGGPDGRCVCVARPDVTCRCGAVRCDVLR